MADFARSCRLIPADDPGSIRQLPTGQAAAHHCYGPRLGVERQRTRTVNVEWRQGRRIGLPLRAAAILAPLSSRTDAPRTKRSHNVARKGRVPRVEVISF